MCAIATESTPTMPCTNFATSTPLGGHDILKSDEVIEFQADFDGLFQLLSGPDLMPDKDQSLLEYLQKHRVLPAFDSEIPVYRVLRSSGFNGSESAPPPVLFCRKRTKIPRDTQVLPASN
jgi:hypothetical protein